MVNLPFSRQEYAQRLAKTRAAMQQQGLELLLVTDPSNMAWLTGYDGWSFYVHQCVLLALDGEPIWFGRGQDANGARRTVFMQHDNIVGYPDIYVQSRERHPMDYLCQEVILAKGWGGLSIGVEMDNYYFSAAAYQALCKHLPQARFSDAAGLVNWQRAVKSPQEIEYMRIAARIVEQMHGCILETHRAPACARTSWWPRSTAAAFSVSMAMAATTRPSCRCCRLAQMPARRTLPGTIPRSPAAPARSSRLPAATSATTARCRAPCTWASRRNTFSMAKRRWSKVSRPASMPARPGKYHRWTSARAFFRVLEKFGIHKDSRCGYPIGISYPPDWGERTMSLRPSDTSVLQPGMTFHFMPGLWMDDWGPGDHRKHPHHRDRGRDPVQRAAPAVREGLTHECNRTGRRHGGQPDHLYLGFRAGRCAARLPQAAVLA
ncbi:EutD ectoine utilization protein [Pseudomonas putida S11]|nr:EutD ectoine utilization protein [Pseudomonas putida S11]